VKIIDNSNFKRKFFLPKSESFDIIENEVKVIGLLNSNFIVNVYEILRNKNCTYIIMEYMKNGTILNKIKKQKFIKEKDIWKYFVDLIKGLDYLHETAKIIHFDIKVDNLLIDNKEDLKISDFSISRSFIDDDDTFQEFKQGCPFYLAPEMTIKNEKFHGKAVDIWACGVVLYYMTFSKLPFYVNSQAELKNLYEQIRSKE
jgi:serine/threonine protein kinase